MSIQRPLGAYERYSLARHNVQQAPGVVFHALVPHSPLLSPQRFLSVISILLSRYPLLRSTVYGARSPLPQFQISDSFNPQQVLRIDESSNASGEELVLEALSNLNRIDIEADPLWNITVSYPQEKGKTRIILSVHHVLSDGGGTRSLFVRLLQLLKQPTSLMINGDNDKDKDIPFPPSLETTINVKPSTYSLLQTLFQEFILPKIPSFLAFPRPNKNSFWPNPRIVPPRNQPTGLKLLHFDRVTTDRLKENSKRYGVKTLQPVLNTVVMYSIITTILKTTSTTEEGKEKEGEKGEKKEIFIKCQTPISIRSESLGHPLVTGNYVSSLPYDLKISPTDTDTNNQRHHLSTTNFWESTRKYAGHLNDQRQRKLALEGMGMLEYLSKGDTTQYDPITGEIIGDRTTGFESWLEDGMKGLNPWRGGSFEVSNLGKMDRTEWEADEEGIEEVWWAQPGSSVGVGLAFNAVSSPTGHLSISLTYRLDSISSLQIDEIYRSVERVLNKVARDEVGGEMMLDQVYSFD